MPKAVEYLMHKTWQQDVHKWQDGLIDRENLSSGSKAEERHADLKFDKPVRKYPIVKVLIEKVVKVTSFFFTE
jgi:hypothetical protein